MRSVQSILEACWPVQQVQVECDVCGEMILENANSIIQDVEMEFVYPAVACASQIKTAVAQHRKGTGHESVTVTITEREFTEAVDITVTVECRP